MTLYAISDLHGNLPKIPSDAAVLLLAGDICPDYRPQGTRMQGHYVDVGGAQQSGWLDTTFRRWLNTRPANCAIYAVWGNHDFVGEKPHLVPDLPWTLLNDRATTFEYEGKRRTLYGTPWVPGLPYWAFYGTDRVLEARSAGFLRSWMC